jgi:hypothetical protein
MREHGERKNQGMRGLYSGAVMAYFGLPLAGFEDLPRLGYGRGREKNTRAIATWRQGEAGESRARRGSD